jgi:hypothetical protein
MEETVRVAFFFFHQPTSFPSPLIHHQSGACRGHVRVELCFMLGENARGDAFESGALVNGPVSVWRGQKKWRVD